MAAAGHRILMTTDTVGGVWNYAVTLTAELSRRGHQILLVALGPTLSSARRQDLVHLHKAEFVWQRSRLCWMDHPWSDIERARGWLLELEQDFRPTVVHVNTLGHASANWSSPLLTVAHSCVFSWFEHVRRSVPPAHWERYHAEVAQGLRSSDQVIAPTRAMVEDLRQHYDPLPLACAVHNGIAPMAGAFAQLPPEAIPEPTPAPISGPVTGSVSGPIPEPIPGPIPVPIPVPVPVPIPVPSRRAIPTANSPADPPPLAPPRTPVVIAAGRLWDDAKNLTTLARIAPRLPWPVQLAGEDHHPTGARAPFPGVELLGLLSHADLMQRLQTAEILAHPARYEPFGLTALEAARAGCALVLGDIPSLRELWHGAAQFVDPDDEDALADVLTALIEDEQWRRRLQQSARARATRYGLTAMANRYEAIYAALAEGPAAGPRSPKVGTA